LRSDQYIASVIAKCDNLVRTGLWRGSPVIRVNAWMNNFESADKVAAAMLLDHFVFFSNGAVEAMLKATYRQFQNKIFSQMGSLASDYLEKIVFTSVEGEDPNVTDSGNFMCRKLRQVLALPDSRFVEPIEALRLGRQGQGVVFVDDFLGSGSQFLSTWGRGYFDLDDESFKSLFEKGKLRAHYLVLVATRKGIDRLRSDVDGLAVTTSHIVDEFMSVRSLPWNPLLPDGFNAAEEIPKFLNKYARRLKLSGHMDYEETRAYGHNSFGLLLAFEHSTPDATIPILWAEGESKWTPLIRRV